MPFIIIQTKEVECPVNIENLAHELSQKMSIRVERINIIVNYFNEANAFMGGGTDNLIVNIWVSETNEKEFIWKLAKTIAALTAKYFHKEWKDTAVICNFIKEKYLFVNDQFI